MTIAAAQLRALAPQARAALLLEAARAPLARPLWQAALGEAAPDAPASAIGAAPALAKTGLEALLDLATAAPGLPPPAPAPAPARVASAAPGPLSREDRPAIPEAYAAMVREAAQRTGLPAATLAAIIGAEAGDGAGGWRPLARNPRSSAAGLGQFLAGTWLRVAADPGSWLHRRAAAEGWLTTDGHVRAEARGALLALRYDPRAAIETVADHAVANLAALDSANLAGVAVAARTRAAYLAHQLGARGAIRFLEGGAAPDPGRLLAAQIGPAAAARAIAAAGGAAAAHRAWLLGFCDAHLPPVTRA
ncbi:peptidoglycan-binding protein [Sphingomonas morindae]|uniref:Peptidoglycan-binding protein n=1 Tax=Sphingomonas morindae TaxID=1541170 RepID=A0ABY4X533_9SPHN|nr:peptidoglycan-binding protein [Sphingomonas morindae]USI72012.1 peptidoglycan-binding protein [Sphingomonas morindae]